MADGPPFHSGRVAVVGRPNVGKSTLVNRIVGEKVAIVSAKPQTTRKRVLGVARTPGAEIALVDTPGIHRPHFRMNAAMVRDATDALATADDPVVRGRLEKAGKGETFIGELIARAGTPAVLALNKIDRVAKERLLPMIADFSKRHPFAAIVPISARTGDGVEQLTRVLAEALPEGEPAYPEDFLTSMPETEWIAEVIRRSSSKGPGRSFPSPPPS
jgi:GTP-binding protein Era